MSTLLGIYSKSQQPIPAKWMEAMVTASEPWPHDRHGVSTEKTCIVACLQQFNTPQASYAKQPYADKLSSIQLVFDGRLDNRQELAEQLNIPLTPEVSDEQLILQAYLHYQTALVDHLLGDYVITIYDKSQHQLFLIRDHMGVRPVFISQNEDYFAFASNKNALLSLPWVNKRINQQWLADYLTITKVDHHTTFYQAIETLPAAHWIQVQPSKTEQQRYWQLDVNKEFHYENDEKTIEQFKALLLQAVNCRLRSYGEVASELSGGLDSTTITSIASKLLDKQNQSIHAVSHVLPPENEGKIYPFKDEKRYIKALLKTLKNVIHYPIYSRDRGIIDVLTYAQKIHASPVRNDLTLMSDELFEILKETNTRTLLSGFGGDQLVTSQAQGWLSELSHLSLWQSWRHIPYYVSNKRQYIRFFLSIIKHKIPHHIKYDATSSQMQWNQRLQQTGIHPEFAAANGYPQRYFNNPLRQDTTNSVRQDEFLVIHSPHVGYRLEDSALGAASHGVDYRYPLLDIRLLQFCLSLPTHQKIRLGMNRRMIRMATIGLLPDIIRLRHDKSRATIPTVTQRLIKDRDDLKQYINTLKTNQRIMACCHIPLLDRFINDIVSRTGKHSALIGKSFFRIIGLALWIETYHGNDD